jgi:hypothetical protein
LVAQPTSVLAPPSDYNTAGLKSTPQAYFSKKFFNAREHRKPGEFLVSLVSLFEKGTRCVVVMFLQRERGIGEFGREEMFLRKHVIRKCSVILKESFNCNFRRAIFKIKLCESVLIPEEQEATNVSNN